jgi:hypothetical protein
MLTCEKCRAALLDRQYGLLDAADAAALDAHVAACPACRTERAKVERFGRLLSAAARTDFPDVRFVAPAEHTGLSATRSLRSGAGRSRAPFRAAVNLVAWAVAACLVLGMGIPAGAHFMRTSRQRTELAAAIQRKDDLERQRSEVVAKHGETLTLARAAVQKAAGDITTARAKLDTGLALAEREVIDKQLNFVITGPKAVEAGLPATYRIQTLDNANRPTPATISYTLRDGNNKAVSETTTVATAGEFNVPISPAVPLKPNHNLFLEVSAQRADGATAAVREELRLSSPVYVTHLTTDKPLYQPGEIVRLRSLTLDRASLKPAEEPMTVQFVVRNPQGAETPIAAGLNQSAPAGGKPVPGVAAAEWRIPPGTSGGEYTLAIKELNNRFPEERRKFLVNVYTPARLNKVLEWSRKSFGPGDEVVANCRVTSASGPVANKPVTARATVDGQPVEVPPSGPTSANGTVAVRFTLPKSIERGEGTLSVSFTDGGSVESLNKPIPIALKKLAVEFFTEGGDLVAGVPNRIYFQARTTLGKPADLKGRVVDAGGRGVAAAATLTDADEPGINQGMGRVEFTPEFGQSYKLLIDQPAGTEGEYGLPAVQPEGVVLTALNEVSGDPDPIRVRVVCPSVGRALLVGAYARGRLLDHKRLTVAANQSADVELKPDAGVGGVTRVTVFEELPGDGPHKQLRPRAERLIFRKPAAAVKLSAEPDKARYLPGDHVTLSLQAQTEKGEPAAAVAVLGVVNKSVVTMADEKTFRIMPTHFLLTSEVQRADDLEHADVLLGTHPKAAAALDLLLGTQGWRRFTEKAVPPVKSEDDDRIAVALVQSPPVTTSAIDLARQKVQEAVGPEVAKAQYEYSAATDRLSQAQADKRYTDESQRLTAELATARSAVQTADSQLSETLATRERTLGWLLPATCAMFLAVALVALAIGLWRGLRYYVTAAGSLGLAAAAAVLLALRAGGPDVADMQTASAVRGSALATVEQLNEEGLGDGAPAKLRKGIDAGAQGVLRNQARGFGGAPPPGAKLGGGNPMPVVAPMAPAQPLAAAPSPETPPAGAAKPANEPAPVHNAGVGKAAAPKQAEAEFRRGEARDLLDLKAQAPDYKRDLGRKDGEKLGVAKNRQAADDEMPAILPPLAGGIEGQPEPGGGGFGGAAGGPEVDRLRRRGVAMRKIIQPVPQPFVVREYAHHHVAHSTGVRTDFAETVFWHPVLVLPAEGAKVSFDLGDEVTRYQVLVAAHTGDGRLGALETEIEARKPFSLEPKLPAEISAGDRIDVPVTLANDTDASRVVTVTAHPKGLTLTQGAAQDRVTLSPQQSARRVFRFRPAIVEGTAELRLTGRCDPFGDDAVVRTVPVVPEGFPVIGAVSDVIDGLARHEIVLPATWVPGTLKCQVSVYPSTLAELQKGLEGLLREPGGCFEQTSTTNYPNALVLQYLRESDQANPAVMKQAKEMLERGYAKLTSFEVQAKQRREGFEWFGQAPAHEALTAYGLMQFRDMARVSDVDPQLLRRTRDYLLARRDGKGGFARNPQALDTFGRAPADVTNAYIVWALTESGNEDDVTKELNALAEEAKSSDDPYFLALVANSMLNRDRVDEAAAILRTLAGKLTKDGYLDGAKTSITGSAGRTLQIETTALAVLGWLRSARPEFAVPVRAAVGWIGKQRGGYGGFGSTQSTILALKALIAYTKANKKTAEAGELGLAVGDRVIGKLSFAAGTQEALTVALPDAERQLKPGKNDVRVLMTGKNNFPYTLTWSYQTLQPPTAEGCAVRLTTSLNRETFDEGDPARMTVKLENVSGKGQGMAVAIVGLPAGLRLPDDFAQLKDLCRLQENGTKPGRIGAFEVRGRELVLYWRDLATDAVVELNIDLRAQVPGEYHGPASRAYLYYNPDAKYWTAPLGATIAAKE